MQSPLHHHRRRRASRAPIERAVGASIERLERRLVLSALTIAQENALPGTPQSVWDVSGIGDPTLQGYATDISTNVGGTVQFKINDTTGASYHIDIYRMGYYQGNGARLVTTIATAQTTETVQPAPITDSNTGLVDCGNWSVSASWTVPTDATSGIYFARLVRDDTGGASHVVFVVRNDASHSDLLFQTSDSTWEAYNTYGGNSLYQGNSLAAPGRAVKVSYNRPFNDRATTGGLGSNSWVFYTEYPMVRFLEKNGYDVSYFTDVDSDRNGALIKNHKAFLSVGHDEYWSGGQLANVTAARDAGVNLDFFSGDQITWKTRWENSVDGSGTPFRTLVCYKETTANTTSDPLDPTVWTGTWRDPRFSPPADGGRPENALAGTIFMVDRGANDVGTPIIVPASDAAMRVWRNTAVASLTGSQTLSLGTAILGYEWNVDLDNGFRPAGLIDLSSTTQNVNELIQDYGTQTAPGVATHSITYYKAASGARVYDVGTVQWAWGLDSVHDGQAGAADVNVQQATVNMLTDDGVQPATLQAGLVAGTASSDTVAPTSRVTSPGAGATVNSGTPVTITGTALDTGGGVVGGVEVSTDGGLTWHPATGHETWTYTWIPGALGSVKILTRATDDSGNIETPGAGVTVTVNQPLAPLSIFSPSATPITASANDANSVELGVRFRTDVSGFITGIRFYKGVGNSGTHVGSLWTSGGTLLASATFTGESASGWQTVSFTSPVAVTAGTAYVASYHAPAGGYSVSYGYFATTNADNGPLHALPDTAAGRDGLFIYSGATTFPIQTSGSNNYFVDVVFSTTLTDTIPPTVIGEFPAPSAGSVDPQSVVTATFSESINPTALTFTLKGPGGTSVPATVTYNDATHTATLDPSAALASNTTYTASVSGAQDLAGNTMTAPFTWSFTTATTSTGSFSIWTTQTPTNPASSDGTAVQVGVKFRSDISGFITALRFYKGTTNTGTHVGNLWTSTGTLLATGTFSNETASGWQTLTFAQPVAIAANTVYVASYYAPVGHYAADNAYFASVGVDNAPLHALANGVSGGDGVYVYGTSSSFPSNSFNSTNYWVDVVFATTVVDTTPPTVTAQTPAPGAGSVDPSTSVTATFSESIQSATLSFTLKGPGGTSIPATVTYNDSTHTATLTPTAALANNTTYTATVSGAKDQAGNTMTSAVTWSFTTVVAGGATVSIWPTQTPTNPASSDGTAVQVGVKFRSDINGFITGIRFYKGTTNTGTHVGNLWTSTGTLLATGTFTGETASGWQTLTFASPLAITANTVYVASYYAPVGHYASDNAYFATTGADNAPLHALANGVSGGDGVYVYGTSSSFPSNSFNSTNYWVDVVFASTIADTTPPTVTAQTPAPGATGVATNTTVTATFSEAVQSSTIVFTLKDASGNTVPATVAYNATTNVATLTPTAALANGTTYTATVSGAKDTAGNVMTSPVTWSFTTAAADTTPPSVTGQSPASGATNVPIGTTATATFSESVQSSTISFTLKTAAGVSVAGTVTYNDTTHTATFTPTAALAASTSYTATVTGVKDLAGNTMTGSVAWSFTTAAVDTTPPTVTGQSPASGATNVAITTAVTATFSESVQAATISFTLKTAGGVSVAGTVTYNDTTHTATFTPSAALAGSTSYTATVTGAKDLAGNTMAGSVSWSFTTTANTTFSLWTTQTPTNPASNDGTAVQVGVKIRADSDGFINGIRFYKGTTNTGTHVGNLWTSTGTLLATGTFTGETASGWQTLTFAQPVAITANTVYVASYYAPVGHYAADNGFFAGTGVDSGPLHALADGVSGGDGVYVYGTSSSFPSNSFASTNYWVDVVYTAGAPAKAWKQTTTADFGGGTNSGTTVTNAAGGEVALAQPTTETFTGTALGSGWTTTSWAPAGGGPTSVTVSGGILTMAGAEIQSAAQASATPVEALLSFGAAPYQHFGVATDMSAAAGNNWAVFSTLGSTNTLYARVNANGATQDVSLGALPTGFHTYRIQPIAGAFEFFVDGVLQTTLTAGFASGSPLKVTMSAFYGTPSMQVDSITYGSYASTGTFTSSVFDAGASVAWGTASWTLAAPAGTTAVIQVRSGNTATPDGTWSAFTTVATNGGAIGVPNGRYLQYRITFTTTDPLQTPSLSDILFTWT